MSAGLRAATARHLAGRRARGYRLEGRERLLGGFLDGLDARGQTRITVPAAITFATAPPGTTRAWHAQRLAAVRHSPATSTPSTRPPPTRSRPD